MGKVLLSTGAYAKTPYYLEGLGIRVYSAEELCYVLKEDAFFLDRSIVDRKLIRWIEEELMLPKLAAALYPLLQKKTDPGTFAGIILQYVHLYENDVIKKTEAVYREGAGLSPFEKQKNRVDHLLTDGRYRTAAIWLCAPGKTPVYGAGTLSGSAGRTGTRIRKDSARWR